MKPAEKAEITKELKRIAERLREACDDAVLAADTLEDDGPGKSGMNEYCFEEAFQHVATLWGDYEALADKL